MKIGRTTWIDYIIDDSLGVLVRLSARMEDGSKFNGYVKGTDPYIFVPEDEGVPEKRYIKNTETGYESLFGKEYQKIITNTPKQAGGLKEEFTETGEADIPYYRRVSVHDGLSGYNEMPESDDQYNNKPLLDIDDINTNIQYEKTIEPKVGIEDIEVRIGEESFERTREKGSQPINVICIYDTYKEDYTVFFYNKHGSLDKDKISTHIDNQLLDTGIEEHAESKMNLVSVTSESDMLKEYMNHVNQRGYDVNSGWNHVDFDRKYLIERIKTLSDEGHDIDYRWLSPFNSSTKYNYDEMQVAGLPPFDMMVGLVDIMSRGKWRSKSLEYVSDEELGIGKIDDVDINKDWKENPSKLIAYNIVDTILCAALDQKNDVHNFFYDMADVCSIPIWDVYKEKRQVDGYVMSRRKHNEILPTADKSELIENAGGYVSDAIDGIEENVGVIDLKSLYPSSILTWNLSSETVSESPENFDEYVKIPKVPEPKDVNGDIDGELIEWDWLYASLDQEGLIPRTTKKLFNKRNREKQKMYNAPDGSDEEEKWDRAQASTKIVMNSIYGNLSSKYYRLSNDFLGDAVTSTARYTLWKGKQKLNDMNYSHVYSDTDSHMLNLTKENRQNRITELQNVSEELDEDASTIAQDIGIDGKHPYLKGGNLHGDDYTCLVWEAEKIYSTFLMLNKKKRYAGNLEWKEEKHYDEPEMGIKGFENRRSDSPKITSELQEKVLEMVLTDASFVDLSEYIQSIIDQIDANADNIERFALPGSLNRDLEDYTNTQITRGARYSNEHMDYEFGEGDDPFIYLVSETPAGLPNTDVVAFEWDESIPEGFVLDKEAIVERGIRKPIEGIIEEAGWSWKEVRSGKKTKKKDLTNDGGNPFA